MSLILSDGSTHCGITRLYQPLNSNLTAMFQDVVEKMYRVKQEESKASPPWHCKESRVAGDD